MKKDFSNFWEVEFQGIKFETPFLPASGTFGYGFEVSTFSALNCFGGLITKGLSLKPREGNNPPRIKETHCGLMNSIGLENPGVGSFLKDILPIMSLVSKPIIVNLAGHDEEEFLKMIEILNPMDKIVAYEINISCPNVSRGGLEFYKDKDLLRSLLKGISNVSNKLNIVKIPPEIFNYNELVKISLECGFTTLTVANTYPALILDIERESFYFERRFAGLSGPAIFPLTLRLVYEIKRKFPDVHIIASGGVVSFREALQYFFVGAEMIQIGTGNFINPSLVCEIKLNAENYLISRGYSSVREVIGKLQKD